MTRRTRLEDCYRVAKDQLLDQRNSDGHWEGELSASPLSTATAVVALEMVRRGGDSQGEAFHEAMRGGLAWIAEHQNEDGGWGDTVKSVSNISTSMLCHAAFHAAKQTDEYRSVVEHAQRYIDEAGGVAAVLARYGKDRTFSIPILTHCALAGLVDWRDVVPLPFELSCIPAQFYKTVGLPVVSYALPALIAIGQVRHHFRKTWNPITRVLRWIAAAPSLRVLERIQPTNGGFLEATPLTSFVTMSLAAMGRHDHPVARRGVEFIMHSRRDDGSWPIDTNLATWVTTLSVNALGDDLPIEARPKVLEWLIGQQYRDVHPYTNADPGGWAWTDLPGGVPDADDTPGGILAVLNLRPKLNRFDVRTKDESTAELDSSTSSIAAAVRWLLDLQNRDAGWPTFCRGWGKLPFDRSSADISAHVIRALDATSKIDGQAALPDKLRRSAVAAIKRGFKFLEATQRPDGSWLPLWFGNQFVRDDENPTYGTARVLLAYRDKGRLQSVAAQRGLAWLTKNQNDDGGWGGSRGIDSSVEETALAVEALVGHRPSERSGFDPSEELGEMQQKSVERGLDWLMSRVESGTVERPTPIGFYFAKLWYFESLYPLIFAVSALRRAALAGCLESKST